jgi:hypothetical protein
MLTAAPGTAAPVPSVTCPCKKLFLCPQAMSVINRTANANVIACENKNAKGNKPFLRDLMRNLLEQYLVLYGSVREKWEYWSE